MRPAAAIAIAVVLAASTPAAAGERELVYVDAAVNYTTKGDGVLRDALRRSLARAGYDAAFAADADEPCEERDRDCLARRARGRGAAVGVRATWLELAGELAVEVEIVRASGDGAARQIARRVDPDRPVAEIVAALRAIRPEREPSATGGPRIAAWTLTAVSAALATGGVLAVLEGRAREQAFFDDHVDARGDVVGISRDEARAAEDRALAWSLAGVGLLTAATAAGVTAGVLFADDGGESRPAGVTVAGRF